MGHTTFTQGPRGDMPMEDGMQAKSVLTKIASFAINRNMPFLVCSIGMIVMLLRAGKFKNDSARSGRNYSACYEPSLYELELRNPSPIKLDGEGDAGPTYRTTLQSRLPSLSI